MVKLLHAPVTKVAVVRVLGPQRLAVHTHVVEVVVFGDQALQEFKEVFLLWNVTWVYHGEQVKQNGEENHQESKGIESRSTVVEILSICHAIDNRSY